MRATFPRLARLSLMLSATLLAAPVLGGPAALQAAIDAPDRSAEDRERDATSDPGAVLGLADLETGDTVADLFAGGGYYSELLSRALGPEGRIYAHNNAAYRSFVGAALDTRRLDGRLPNVIPLATEIPELQLPEGELDLALMVLSWHDLYWVSEQWPAVDVDAFVAQLERAMAPDGKLLIVDHAAAEGTGIDAVDALHRIDRDHVVATLEGHGWRLVDETDALRAPADDLGVSVFDPEIRGRTDRFVLLFAPPD